MSAFPFPTRVYMKDPSLGKLYVIETFRASENDWTTDQSQAAVFTSPTAAWNAIASTELGDLLYELRMEMAL